MKVEDLKKLLKKAELGNNLSIKFEIQNLIKCSNNSEISWISLSFETYEFLINNGLSINIALSQAMNFSHSSQFIDKIINLALNYFYDLNQLSERTLVNLSESNLKLLLDHGLKPEKLLQSALYIDVIKYNHIRAIYYIDEEIQAVQDNLLKIACKYGANVKFIQSLPINLSASSIDLLIKQGLNANIILKTISNSYKPCYTMNEEFSNKIEQLLSLTFEYAADINDIKSLPILPSLSLIEKLFGHGLTLNNALQLILNSKIDECEYINNNTRYSIDPVKIELQSKLIKEILIRGADLNKIANKIKTVPELLVHHQELIINHLNSDNLLMWAIQFANEDDGENQFNGDQDHKKQAYELIKIALAKGANVNINIDGYTPLELINDPELIDLLKSHGAKCNYSLVDEIFAGDLAEIFLKPAIMFEQKYKNLDAIRADEAKMPYTLHHIWLTSAIDPKEIRAQDLKIVLDNKALFTTSSVKWEHIVWTNDKNLIPESVRYLEEHGIKVQSIYDYQKQLSLFTLIEELIEQEKWGMSSDTLRYSLIEYFGGVYADLNFIFNRDITDETHKYNFFTKTYASYYIDNFFFGASPHHPVLERILQLVERNLIAPPKYLADISNQDSREITDMGTANPTFLAYYKKANKNGNIDVVYPKTQNKNDVYYTEEADDRKEISDVDYAEIMRQIEYINKKCPAYSIFNTLTDFIENNEICGAEIYMIGRDSIDGQTWLN